MICEKEHRYDPQYNDLPVEQGGEEDIGVLDVLTKEIIRIALSVKNNWI